MPEPAVSPSASGSGRDHPSVTDDTVPGHQPDVIGPAGGGAAPGDARSVAAAERAISPSPAPLAEPPWAPPARSAPLVPPAPVVPPAPAALSADGDTETLGHSETLAAYRPPATSAGSPRVPDPAADQGAAWAQPPAVPPPTRPGRRRPSMVTAAVLGAVVLLGAAGSAAWLIYHHHAKIIAGQHRPASNGTTLQSSHQPSAQPTASPSTTPTLSPTSTPTSGTTPGSGGSLVALGPAVVPDAQTSRVEAVVNAYFTAINDHSFQQYQVLHNPATQASDTPQSFNAGYRTTTDSGATITSISPASARLLGASVTFVSHQQPSDSATGTACTNWTITLYLEDYAGQYLIASTPPGYHAQFSAC